MDLPIVSVVIVNWNGRKYLEDCLSSLKEQTFRFFEVILVDNGSLDGSVDFVQKYYSDMVFLIKLSENMGFAKGNNIGIEKAKGKYIALLNNDTEVDKNWLKNLVSSMETDENIGMVGSKILNFYYRDQIDNTGHLIYQDGINRGRGRLEIDCKQFDDKIDILFPSGCASLYRKKMLDEIGGFDEMFFAYGDDTDIGLHGRYLGYKAIYCPNAIVFHKYSGTTGSYSPIKAFYVERNRLWILIKYFPIEYILISPYFTIKRLLFQLYGMATKQGAASKFASDNSFFSVMKIFFSSYLSSFKGISNIIKKRKIILRKRKISIGEFKMLLKEHRISCKEISLKD
ncbi:MAG: glycosyltransferase family 2 protein [Desulfobacterales bacterium]|nr:glycosyltransferase family 2 protein [Desulfobacterales bacterium]